MAINTDDSNSYVKKSGVASFFRNNVYDKITLKGFGTEIEKLAVNSLTLSSDNNVKNTDLTNGNRGVSMLSIYNDAIANATLQQHLSVKALASAAPGYAERLRTSRAYANKGYIRTYLNILSQECIVENDDDNKYCRVRDLPESYSESIRKKYLENFEILYNLLQLNLANCARDYFTQLLVDGFLTFEIVYDDRRKNVVGIRKLDPIKLTITYDEVSKRMIWVYNYTDVSRRVILTDADIIYISYANHDNVYRSANYVEPLIKPFNQLNLLENLKIMFQMNTAMVHRKFIIPMDGIGKKDTAMELGKTMASLKENFDMDDSTGTFSIDGSANLHHQKDIFLTSNEGAVPTIEYMNPAVVDLTEDTQLKYFRQKLIFESQIPPQRFMEDQGGGNIISNDSDVTRDEYKFNDFKKTLRKLFKEIITKPLKIQTFLDFPELIDDRLFSNYVDIKYYDDENITAGRKLKNMESRANIASTLNNVKNMKGESVYPTKYILKKVMNHSDSEISEIMKEAKEEMTEQVQPTQPTQPSGGGGGMESEIGGGTQPTTQPTSQPTPQAQTQAPPTQEAPPA